MDDLIVYTLRVRAPSAWDDMKAESAALSLTEALESALQAVSSYINNLHPEIELVIEQ